VQLMNRRRIVVVVHNVRSSHNVGSILRTSDGMRIDQVYLSGYTPYPAKSDDQRLPHIQARVGKQIQKTALGAEKSVSWIQVNDINPLINKLKKEGFLVVALEQTPKAKALNKFTSSKNIALIVGNEVSGLDEEVLKQCEIHLEIPMQGSKESLNVAISASMALYHLRFYA
jgi:23S rRNA (guanosine2251-2'-O)-methyltransferase